jgi:hypothetical protein
MEELSNSQENELEALSGNRMSVLRVVSDLRRYRAAAKTLLSQRYRDGECDAVALADFYWEVDEIENE